MRCLVVGAGAVGQVYGRHLREGGAEVAFMVKPKYAAGARAGFALYPLNDKKSRTAPVHFVDFDVVTTTAEVAERSWDAVILCVSSTALRAGSWFGELAHATGDATIVTLQPGMEDYAFIAQHAPAERIVSGLIGMASYAAPLDGESLPEPGTAYWFPPLMKCPFSGEAARVEPLIAAFRRGGLPAARHKDVQRAAAFGTALLQTQICALEIAGWSIRDLRRDKQLMRVAHRAMREASAIGARERGTRVPLAHRLVRPYHLGLFLNLAARMAPMDMERFFELHYTKVRDQSLDMLQTWIALADRHDLSSEALRELYERMTAGAAAEAPAAAAATSPS